MSFCAHLYSLCTRFCMLIICQFHSSYGQLKVWLRCTSHLCYGEIFPPKFTTFCFSANNLRATSAHLFASKQLSELQRDPTHSHTNYFHFNCNMLVVPTAIKIRWPHTTHPKQQHHPLVPCHHFHPLNYGKPQKIQRIQIASTAISVLMPLIKFITTS